MSYEYLDATADVVVRAVGKDLKTAFEEGAKALFNLITDTKKVDSQEIKLVAKKAKDIKSLLYDFIEEIIYLHDAEGLVFKTVKVEELDEKNNTIKAVINGESFNPKKHSSGSHVKAVTYHDMRIDISEKEAVVEFMLDL